MAGTKTGGQKAAAAIKAKDPDFYKRIGAKGGRNGHTGGFAVDDRTWLEKLFRKPARAQLAGRKSKRRKYVQEEA